MSRTALCLTGLALTAILGSLHWSARLTAKEPAGKSLPAAKAPARENPISAADSIATSEQIEAALDRPINVSFRKERLADCLEHLKNFLNVQIRFDNKELVEIELALKRSISLQLNKVRARQVLSTLLYSQDLAYVVEEGVLLITTKLAEAELLETEVYEVASLKTIERDSESLINVITVTLSPDSWDQVGGPGSIVCNRNTLIIRQTRQIHRQIHRLLTQLKEIGAQDPNAPQPDDLVLIAYPVSGQPAEQLATTLQELVSPKSWQAAGGPGEIRAVGSLLFIRQTPANHRELSRLLEGLVLGAQVMYRQLDIFPMGEQLGGYNLDGC